MACYTIRMVTLELKNANVNLLRKALLETGEATEGEIRMEGDRMVWAAGNYDRRTGLLASQNGNERLAEIKKSYAARTVEAKMNMGGWKLTKRQKEAKKAWAR